ncbi:hypothetical protein ERO13_A11G317250v2 [Gossypium hirsutum]|uniref:Uncharacterized protein n=2 Tax=Gossypium TaxID=3633 RepID=A0A5D2NJS4_GOSTO|nr:hypothetical protein ERO13_A11G317250v2 [Gossypium hirsutum]TYG96773.1 hypothetical protein ES288_A11G379600v1 [Gossypium darwinii]TYI03969.1 hypothetical protein ES332_A11G381100v1 [Gossypium tomentosum]
MFGNGNLLLLQMRMPYVWPFVELELEKHGKWPFMHINEVLFSNSSLLLLEQSRC